MECLLQLTVLPNPDRFLHLFTINRHPLKVPMKVALLLNGIFSVFIILPAVFLVAVQRCLPLRCLIPLMCCDSVPEMCGKCALVHVTVFRLNFTQHVYV